MSDVAPVPTPPVETPDVAEAPVEAPFDLDTAVDEFASQAPDEWKGKAGKIQQELKSLRERFAPYRDTFDDLHEADRDGIFGLVKSLKAGNTSDVAKWMAGNAKALAGDQFEEILAELTPAQQDAVEEALEEGPVTAEAVQKLVQEGIKDALSKREQDQAQERQMAAIKSQLVELGYKGDPTDFETQQVMILARDQHKGDLAKGHEAYQTWVADRAKAYVLAHQGDPALVNANSVPGTSPDPEFKDMSTADRIARRIADNKAAGT